MNKKEFLLADMQGLIEQVYGMGSKKAIEAQNKLLAKIRKERDRKTLEKLLWKEIEGEDSDEV